MIVIFYDINLLIFWQYDNVLLNYNFSEFITMNFFDSDDFYASNDEQKSESLSVRESYPSRWWKHYVFYTY